MIKTDYVLEQFYSLNSGNYLEDLYKIAPEALWYVLGRNECSKSLIKKLNIRGLVDDFELIEKYWENIPILRSDELPEGAVVINCSFSISPISADKLLKSLLSIKTIAYFELHQSNPQEFELPNFVKECRLDLEVNKEKYLKLYERFEDDESRDIFNSLIAYRMTANYTYLNMFSIRFKDQYFEPFIGDLRASIFADCGGFDGDTTEEFVKRYPHYKKVYFFEPDSVNLKKAKSRLKNLRDIEFKELGVSDKAGKLSFKIGGGSASQISRDGEAKISVVPLDSYIENIPLTFIKMDLEGWELKALKGSSKQIKKNKPTLAIAVYHSVSDFWKIPDFVTKLNPNYKIYLRHYTEGWSESVMYFVEND